MNTLPNKFFALTGDGVHMVQVNFTPCGSAEDHLRALANDSAFVCPRAISSSSGPVHIATAAAAITVFTVLPMLKISTHYKPAEGGRLAPVFRPESGSLNLTCEWTPPSNMKLWFISMFLIDSEKKPRYERSSLVAICTDPRVARGTFRPPLPNIHDNGKLCLGVGVDQVQTARGDSIEKCFFNALEIFHRSTWNTDLQNLNPPAAQALFRFDAATNKSVPVPDNWHTLWTRISNVDFNHLPLQDPNYL